MPRSTTREDPLSKDISLQIIMFTVRSLSSSTARLGPKMIPEVRGRNLNQAAPLVPVHPELNHFASSNAFLNPNGVFSRGRGRRVVVLIFLIVAG
ncbi:hypothetical protein TNCV_1711221 [Trichonephila clavipes]|nr:hypothetical protein TNCV_1711221 [Trichonephila clavipes]